jgi:hypothetical protein
VRLFGVEYSGLRQSWKDGKKQRVEARLADVLDAMEAAAEHVKQQRLAQEQRQREWAEAERLRVERWRRDEEEKRRRQELDNLAGAWAEAGALRRFLEAVRLEAGIGGAALEPGSRLAQWLAWADAYAEEVDPVKRVVSGFLDGSGGDDTGTSHDD